MTVVSNDPIWWPIIISYRFYSYFIVAVFVGAMYDFALTFGQEVELVWRRRWSLMTALYLNVRYLGILCAALQIPISVPTISLTDTGCRIIYVVWYWMRVLALTMLCVIMITRLHAMYQESKKILIFLVVIFLADTMFNGVVAVMTSLHTSGEESILSGTYLCSIDYPKNILLMNSITWILCTVWEVLALCLAVWIAVKHFREVRRYLTGGIIRDCFSALMKTHMLYFASFVAISCFNLIVDLSPTPSLNPQSIETETYCGLTRILTILQICVLGPRLILDLREHHAELVADSDAATEMDSIVFQERARILTGNGIHEICSVELMVF